MIALAGGVFGGELTVTGYGKVRLQPDKMKVVFEVSATDKDVAEAKRLFAERSATIADVFAQSGIGTNEVVTSGMEMLPVDDYRNGSMVFVGYKFSEEYTFTAKVDRMRLEKISAALFDCKAVERVRTMFELFDPAAPRREARALAVKDAIATAQDIADAAGVRLCEIDKISYGSATDTRMWRMTNNIAADYAPSEGGSAAALRDIEISDSVIISWKIGQ